MENNKQTQTTINKRIKLMRRVQEDLNAGRYPGKSMRHFKEHYKGTTQFWQALQDLNMIDFKKPCANVILTDVRNVRKATELAYKNTFRANLHKKNTPHAAPQLSLNLHTEKPTKRSYTKRQVKSQTTKAASVKKHSFELNLFWGMVKFKK